MLRQIASLLLGVFFILSINLAAIGIATAPLLYPDVYLQTIENTNVAQEAIELVPGVAFPLIDVVETILPPLLSYLRADTETLDLILSPEDFLVECAECEGFELEPVDVGSVILEETPVEDFRAGIMVHRQATYVALFFSLLLGVLILFLNRSHLKEGIEWLEIDFMLVGVGLIAAGYFVTRYLNAFFVDGTVTSIILFSLLEGILHTLLLIGAVLAGVGLFALLFTLPLEIQKE